ncbi:diacylglycerol kinase [Catenovulum sp. SM1970]|uniref:diacylglycerol kinase n=1 Tax=Marinifaba aquimaris TaxID=2741323 RepID=UPI00157476C0|nr:diacylglycerol kinase [Marinifaba aquimaris]NTS77275.1 diacylglycerol kinase [Marinifaba aquimaris]
MSEIVKPNGQGLNRIIKAGYCSVKGLRSAWQQEAAFRQELTLAAILTPIAIFTSDSFGQFLLLFSTLLLVLIVELLNSAIEATVDRISLEHHKLAGQAKDMGSAAVALSLLMVVLVWGYHVYQLFAN